MESLRILFVWEWLVLGAPERTLARKVCQLRRRGHSVWLASAGGPLLREIVEAGARHLTLPTLSQAVMAPTLREAACDWARLDELVEREKIEIIDTVAVKPFLYSMPIARRRGIPIVLEAVSPSHLVPRDAREDLGPLFAQGGVVATEPEWGHAYRAHGIDTAGLRVIPSMVDTDVFRQPTPEERATARAALGIGESERLVLAVSRFDRDKAPYLERLVNEFHDVISADPEARLLLAGDGTAAEEINARARAYHGGRARRVAGTTDPAQVALWYFAADVFVGRGMSVLEAAACGVPAVVASEDFMTPGRGPGLKGAAVGIFGEDGYQATGSAGTRSTTFAERILALIADADRRRAVGAQGVRAVREGFNVGAVVSKWEAYYAERLARSASTAGPMEPAAAALIDSEIARRG